MISTPMFLSLYTFVRTNQMFVLINIKEFEPPKGKKKKGKKGGNVMIVLKEIKSKHANIQRRKE